jgi:hypothetical protein
MSFVLAGRNPYLIFITDSCSYIAKLGNGLINR